MNAAFAIEPTAKPFGRALSDLLRETDYTTSMGNPNWHAFSEALGIHYETLRKAVAGEREVSETILVEVSRALGIDPSHFAEYRMLKAREMFDPREVGFEKAMENVRKWAEQQPAAPPKRKRR